MKEEKDLYSIVKYPLSTEKSIGMIKANNSLIFVVDNKANKTEIKKAVEEMLKKKVKSVNTNLDVNGRKLAYVQFAADTPALDVATQLGML
mgnify:CR=1 FL=1